MRKHSTKFPRVIVLFAKILMSGVGIVDIRGKIQGTVMSKGKSGAIARVKVTPVNPQSSFQQEVRALFTFFAQSFRSLTPEQVTAWNATANSSFEARNIFGNLFKRSGINLYIGLNTNLANVGVAPNSDPPAPDKVGNMFSMEPTAAEGAATMFVKANNSAGGNTVDAGNTLVVLGTPPVSNGRTFVKSQFRRFATIAAGSNTDTTNILTDYEARFGPIAAGDKIFLQVNAVNITTGQAGIPLQASIVVAA